LLVKMIIGEHWSPGTAFHAIPVFGPRPGAVRCFLTPCYLLKPFLILRNRISRDSGLRTEAMCLFPDSFAFESNEISSDNFQINVFMDPLL